MRPVADVNSRLHSYFFLRRQLGKDYLTLLPGDEEAGQVRYC